MLLMFLATFLRKSKLKNVRILALCAFSLIHSVTYLAAGGFKASKRNLISASYNLSLNLNFVPQNEGIENTELNYLFKTKAS